MRRKLRSILVAATLAAAGVGCAAAPSSPPLPPGASIDAEIVLQADRDATVGVTTVGLPRAAAADLASALAASTFPQGEWTPVRGVAGPGPSQTGAETARVMVRHAVTPGAPVITVDGRVVRGAARTNGARSVTVSVCSPFVPATVSVTTGAPVVTAGRCRIVTVAPGALPAIRLALHPEPWRWWAGPVGAALALVLGAAAVVALVRRRRGVAAAGAALALAVLVVDALVVGGGQDDALLAGVASPSTIHTGTVAAAVASLAALLVGAGVLVAVSGSGRGRTDLE